MGPVGQRHKIMRQVLELAGCAEDDAPRVQADLRTIFYRRLVPSIERICSKLSAPARLQRIDVLEIDLGEVPLDQLEAVLVEKFDRAFAHQLAQAIDAGGSAEVEVDSALELFNCFIQTGSAPWWADRSAPHLLDTSLVVLLKRAPRTLRAAIASAPAEGPVYGRIARAHPDRLLDELIGVVAPRLTASCPGLGSEFLPLLEIAAGARGRQASRVRHLWWEELLRASIAEDTRTLQVPRLVGGILLRLAGRLEIEYGALIADLHRALEGGAHLPVQQWTPAVLESLTRDLRREAVRADDMTIATRAELETLLGLCERSGRFDRGQGQRMTALLARVPPGERAQIVVRLQRLQERAAPGRDGGDAVRTRGRPLDHGFSDADEIYIENAGLVLLWPFLETLFARLDLIERQQFRNAEARQRAVGLLHYLAAEEAAPPEFLVPLNKVLCGMPVDELFDFGPPIAGVEIEACTELITAAIHHAPVLREMSIRAFRGSFLLRPGQLSVRDGHWLLRVQRETYDIVLDRFPWSAGIVKLPWMSAVLQVEW